MCDATFLDIDDSLKTRNLLLPNKERDALNQEMDELMKQLDSKTIIIQPTPGICIKTRTTSDEKIFINLCVSDKFPSPEDISDDKLLEILDDEVPPYRIPLSIGAGRLEKDKSGLLCETFDVLINSTYLKKCQEKKHFMMCTVLNVLYGVANKYNKVFKTGDFVILKNRKVLGKLQQHRIMNNKLQKKSQGHEKLLIEEIAHSTKPTEKIICSQDSTSKTKTGYVILKKKSSEGPTKHLIVLFDMRRSVSIEDVAVLMNSDRINVTDEKACCSYDVLFPYILKIDTAKALLDYNIGVLRIDIFIE